MREDQPDLLERILSGELDESSPEVREALEANPELARELAELRELDQLLLEDAEDVRYALAGQTGDARAAAPGTNLRRNAFIGALLIAATVLAFLFVPGLLKQNGGIGEGIYLNAGGRKITDLLPEGTASSLELFRVVGEFEADDEVIIRVWDAAGDEVDGPLRSGRQGVDPTGKVFEWRPEPALDFPPSGRIRWDVRLFDFTGTQQGLVPAIEVTRQ